MTAIDTSKLRLHDVFSYRSERASSHCREGMAIVLEGRNGTLVAQDTYWRITRDHESHILTDTEWESAEFLGNLDDFEEITSRSAFNDYDASDQLIVSSQHYLTKYLYIRRGAEKSIDVMVQNAENAVARIESEISSAQWRLELGRRELARLVAERDGGANQTETETEEVAA